MSFKSNCDQRCFIHTHTNSKSGMRSAFISEPEPLSHFKQTQGQLLLQGLMLSNSLNSNMAHLSSSLCCVSSSWCCFVSWFNTELSSRALRNLSILFQVWYLSSVSPNGQQSKRKHLDLKQWRKHTQCCVTKVTLGFDISWHLVKIKWENWCSHACTINIKLPSADRFITLYCFICSQTVGPCVVISIVLFLVFKVHWVLFFINLHQSLYW